MDINEAYEVAFQFASQYNIDMHLDIVFSDELNTYFNWDYTEEDDTLRIMFQVDEGSALFEIRYVQTPEYFVSMNDVLRQHFLNTRYSKYKINMTL